MKPNEILRNILGVVESGEHDKYADGFWFVGAGLNATGSLLTAISKFMVKYSDKYPLIKFKEKVKYKPYNQTILPELSVNIKTTVPKPEKISKVKEPMPSAKQVKVVTTVDTPKRKPGRPKKIVLTDNGEKVVATKMKVKS